MPSVSEFLVERLENLGLKHVFGVPGDYVLNFFSQLSKSKKLDLVGTADEAGAGFAADGYARLNGFGCVVVTYNVGALKVCNSIAGAFAEKSPVIIISGAPGVDERDMLLHHMTDNINCQRQVFKNFTCAQAILENASTAGYEIDRCLEALKHYKQPIYIELPRDIANQTITYDVYQQGTPIAPKTDKNNLDDSVEEVFKWLNESKNPVILAGVEIARCGLGKELMKFAERNNIPIASTLLSKSVIDETHPLYIGVYAGASSSKSIVKDMVENSDCLLACGEFITEATFGYNRSMPIQKRRMVTATINELKVSNHHYPNVGFVDFCNILFKKNLENKCSYLKDNSNVRVVDFKPEQEKKLTVTRLFEKLNTLLQDDNFIVADAGDSLLAASDLVLLKKNSFIGPAFYLSMGFAIPAGLGANLAVGKNVRPVIVTGDGSFQMSCNEISTMLKCGLKPLIFVINNHGYTTERYILDGSFNDILDWNYHDVTKLMGGGLGFKVETEVELDDAVKQSLSSNTLSVINCLFDSFEASSALKKMGEALSKKLKK